MIYTLLRRLALTALAVMAKLETVQAARDEHARATKAKRYISPLPDGIKRH